MRYFLATYKLVRPIINPPLNYSSSSNSNKKLLKVAVWKSEIIFDQVRYSSELFYYVLDGACRILYSKHTMLLKLMIFEFWKTKSKPTLWNTDADKNKNQVENCFDKR